MGDNTGHWLTLLNTGLIILQAIISALNHKQTVRKLKENSSGSKYLS